MTAINVNSNWKGKSTGKIINVDSVLSDSSTIAYVTFHTVQNGDGTAPDPEQWAQVTMPAPVFLSRYEEWITA